MHEYKRSSISLALYSYGEALFGAVYDPYLDEMFYAERGKGAYLNGKRMQASSRKIDVAIAAMGTVPYYKKELGGATFAIAKELYDMGADMHRAGSAAIDLAYVAAGRNDLFFELVLSPWDFAAANLMIKEAGGVVSDIYGNEIDVTKPGSVCDSFINLVDLAPTFLEIGGAAGAEKMDGRSLMPLLRGEKPEDWPKEAYVEFNGYESTLLTIRMIRDERWKYVYNPFAEDELYDMESDPGELRNLAQMPAFVHVLRRMRERMYKKLCEVDDGIVELTSWQSNSYHLLISDRER
jgi:hypothetical protein